MSTAITPASAPIPNTETALVPRDQRTWLLPPALEEALEICEIIVNSALCPKALKKREDVFVAAKFGQELGFSILQSLQNICVINGRPGVYGDAMLALVQTHPDYEWIKETMEGTPGQDSWKAVCTIKRRREEAHTVEFSVLDAKRAYLWDERTVIPVGDPRDEKTAPNTSPWHRYPQRMLKFRARGFCLRDKFADALKGIRSAEELADYPDTEGPVIEGTALRSFTSTPNPPSGVTTISADQIDEFFAAVKLSGKNRNDVREWMRANLTTLEGKPVETSSQIRTDQWEKAIAFAQSGAPPSKSADPGAPQPPQGDSSPSPTQTPASGPEEAKNGKSGAPQGGKQPNPAPPQAPHGAPASHGTQTHADTAPSASKAEIATREGFKTIGWDQKTQTRFIQQHTFGGVADWLAMQTELEALLAKRKSTTE